MRSTRSTAPGHSRSAIAPTCKREVFRRSVRSTRSTMPRDSRPAVAPTCKREVFRRSVRSTRSTMPRNSRPAVAPTRKRWFSAGACAARDQRCHAIRDLRSLLRTSAGFPQERAQHAINDATPFAICDRSYVQARGFPQERAQHATNSARPFAICGRSYLQARGFRRSVRSTRPTVPGHSRSAVAPTCKREVFVGACAARDQRCHAIRDLRSFLPASARFY